MKIFMEPSSAVPLATVLKKRDVLDGKRGRYNHRRKRPSPPSRRTILAVKGKRGVLRYRDLAATNGFL